KADGVPVAVVRGLDWTRDDRASARALVRPATEDLFRRGRGGLAAALAAEEPDAGAAPPSPTALAPVLAAAARRVPGVRVEASPEPQSRSLRVVATDTAADAAVRTGVAAGMLVALLADLGWAADWRADPSGGGAGRPAATVRLRT